MPHHPKMTAFYQKARDLFHSVQELQIAKGAEKYDEPFNPHSWTAEELLDHALQESVDELHYLVGLYDKIKALEEENAGLKEELAILRRSRKPNMNFEESPFVIAERSATWERNSITGDPLRAQFVGISPAAKGEKPPYMDLDD